MASNAHKKAAREYQRQHPGTPFPMALRATARSVVRLVLPATSDDEVSSALRVLTFAVEQVTGVSGDDGLGGMYGYGAQFANEVFTMWSTYWGDCECGHLDRVDDYAATHPHAGDCFQVEVEALEARCGGPDREFWSQLWDLGAQWGLPDGGLRWQCTCGVEADVQLLQAQHPQDCPLVRPNFTFHPSGAIVRWYKWIGRDMEFEGVLPADFLEVCLGSLPLADGSVAAVRACYERAVRE